MYTVYSADQACACMCMLSQCVLLIDWMGLALCFSHLVVRAAAQGRSQQDEGCTWDLQQVPQATHNTSAVGAWLLVGWLVGCQQLHFDMRSSTALACGMHGTACSTRLL